MEFRYIELILFTLLIQMAIKICVITDKRISTFWSHFAPWVFTLSYKLTFSCFITLIVLFNVIYFNIILKVVLGLCRW